MGADYDAPMSQESKPQVVADGKYIQLVRQGGWEYARRKGISGIVGVVGVTDDGKLVLVEQYRAPVRASVIELPAGLAGDAKGHEREDLADEIITLFRATGLKKTGEGTGDETEDITVHEIPLGDVVRWLAEQERGGKLIDMKVYCGLYFARQ